LCRRHGIWIFSDEVYRLLGPDPARHLPQVADIYERGLSLNVLSKAYGLPGLRIGWIACQDTALLSRMERMKHYLSICNSAPSEALGIIALRAADRIVERNNALVRANLDVMLSLPITRTCSTGGALMAVASAIRAGAGQARSMPSAKAWCARRACCCCPRASIAPTLARCRSTASASALAGQTYRKALLRCAAIWNNESSDPVQGRHHLLLALHHQGLLFPLALS
jgi:hypothetical protein